MEITDNQSKEVKKKLQSLIRQLYQECNNLNETHDKAVTIIMSDPRLRGILKHIVDQAVAEATARVMILTGIRY
ncbi:MAG TPA: hypothetical protein DDW27_14765 [Bacteroidales bacterium]|nr:hypothetical protein [Bacteroidales bacterium]